MLGGCVTLILGAVVTFASIDTGVPAVLFVGTAVAGLGFGSAFVGAYRATVAEAASDDRAGMITAIYIVSYLATGIRAVIGAAASRHHTSGCTRRRLSTPSPWQCWVRPRSAS
jgi:MFS family permease